MSVKDYVVNKPEREYYLRVWGFDPERERIFLEKESMYRYEVGFPLKRDPLLDGAGVTIWARVDFSTNLFSDAVDVHNKLVFKRGSEESFVHCIHTAVNIELEEALKLSKLGWGAEGDLARSTEIFPVELSPEEHFVSLRSYVSGIAEMGIKNALIATYHSDQINPYSLPFGFNALMHRQVVRALEELVPKIAIQICRDVVLYIAESVEPAWFLSRFELLNESYDLESILFTDPVAFEAITEVLGNPETFFHLAIFYENTHPEILVKILDEKLHLPRSRGPGHRYLRELSRAELEETLPRILLEAKERIIPELQQAVSKFDLKLVKRHIKGNRALTEVKTIRDKSVFGYAVNPRGRITELGLSSRAEVKKFTTIPDDFRWLGHLEAISFKENDIEHIPPWVVDWVNLEYVDLRSNNLSAFPLLPPNIKYLFLTANKLTNIPDSIEQYRALEVLELTQTGLHLLPGTIGNLGHLRELNLRRNLLGTLPDSLGDLKILKSLNLSGNKLKVIPSVVFELRSLESLDLSDNQLEEIPPAIQNLSRLREFRVNNNELLELPSEVGALVDLRVLEIRGNQLHTLPPSLLDLVHLKKFDYNRNPLKIEPNLRKQLRRFMSSKEQLLELALDTLPENIREGVAFTIQKIKNDFYIHNIDEDFTHLINELHLIKADVQSVFQNIDRVLKDNGRAAISVARLSPVVLRLFGSKKFPDFADLIADLIKRETLQPWKTETRIGSGLEHLKNIAPDQLVNAIAIIRELAETNLEKALELFGNMEKILETRT